MRIDVQAVKFWQNDNDDISHYFYQRTMSHNTHTCLPNWLEQCMCKNAPHQCVMNNSRGSVSAQFSACFVITEPQQKLFAEDSLKSSSITKILVHVISHPVMMTMIENDGKIEGMPLQLLLSDWILLVQRFCSMFLKCPSSTGQ